MLTSTDRFGPKKPVQEAPDWFTSDSDRCVRTYPVCKVWKAKTQSARVYPSFNRRWRTLVQREESIDSTGH